MTAYSDPEQESDTTFKEFISMPEELREFIDDDHKVMLDYYDLVEKYDGSDTKSFKKKLRELIKKDPYYFEPYLLLSEIYHAEGNKQKSRELLDRAYANAVTLILDKEGNWPDIMEWGWLENRHIIRTILEKAISLWIDGEDEKALKLFRKLLHTNPGDNAGVRYYILAIREGMSFTEHEERFNKGGYYDSDSINWFEDTHKEYPDEFDWWDKKMEELGM